MKRKPIATVRAGFALLVVASLGLLSGIAVASTTQDEVPAGVAARQGGRPAPAATPDYPRNAAGQTYGAAHQAVSPDDEPDLILVVARNGRDGYVEREVLNEATGANVSSPEEAVEWQRAQDARAGSTITIPVYASNGRTVVGAFEITPSVLDHDDAPAD